MHPIHVLLTPSRVNLGEDLILVISWSTPALRAEDSGNQNLTALSLAPH